MSQNRWLSKDLLALYEEKPSTRLFDVLIVGSGYGGSMAAAELAGAVNTATGQPLRIGLLERGQEYLPGMFPSTLSDMPPHVRVSTPNAQKPMGRRTGLFDLRFGPDVSALLANGLGGGSLINAGVMEVPKWASNPALQSGAFNATLTQQLTALFPLVKQRLGAEISMAGLEKTEALKSIDPVNFRLADITVSKTKSGLYDACTRCGDCMTGCNANAKKSLDTNLLLEGVKKGLEIYTGASVIGLAFDTSAQHWRVTIVFTNEQARKKSRPLTVNTRQLILAAGSFGSTELLQSAQALTDNPAASAPTETIRPVLSPTLGTRFSCNGDSLVTVYKQFDNTNPQRVHATSDEDVPFDQREVGPTITGIIDVAPQAHQARGGFMLQEFAIPAPLKRLFAEASTTSAALYQLAQTDTSTHVRATPQANCADPMAVDDEAIERTALIGVIGHDAAAGTLRASVNNRASPESYAEGLLHVDWPGAKEALELDESYDKLRASVAEDKIIRNPIWRALSPAMERALGAPGRGPVLTVHPLGGCPIGRDASEGVVDTYGRVFDASSLAGTSGSASAWQGSLVVLDGSIVPASLGANPALTIATLALRATQQLKQDWGYGSPAQAPSSPPDPRWATRPVYRSLAECQPQKAIDTQVSLAERLIGDIGLAGESEPYVAELTLRYTSVRVKDLSGQLFKQLTTEPSASSELRLFKKSVWQQQGLEIANDHQRAQHAVLIAAVDGTLELLNREASCRLKRTWHAGWAWFFNRGLRDIVQEITDRRRGLKPGPANFWMDIYERFRNTLALASRGGEVRRFDYALHTRAQTSKNELGRPFTGTIKGEKRFTYKRFANPLRQLTELKLTQFPLALTGNAVLTLDGRFIAGEGIPLLQISQQQDQVHAMAELASLAAYMTRLTLNNHVWSLRKPDRSQGRTPTLLPGLVEGLPLPDITEIEIDRHATIQPQGRRAVSGLPVMIRLTRYKAKSAATGGKPEAPPLLFIHGYSAGGTTFAHSSLPVSMAQYFWEQGRDVWLLDMRTSPGMLTAYTRWTFEDAALADIPVAVAHIKNATGKPKIDVFAHCIGAVMVSMAILTDKSNLHEVTDYLDRAQPAQPKRYLAELEALPASINRLVLSQKGPALIYSNANAARAYLMRGVRQLLPEQYEFRIPLHQNLAADLLDRALNLLPYSDREYLRENPRCPWTNTAWVGFRHRMDLLYGRDYEIETITPKTLQSIEELFGPLNLETLAQTIHFIEKKVITNAAGRNVFVSPARMQRRWGQIPQTLSVHGGKNGLVDPLTLTAMQTLMDNSGLSKQYQTRLFPQMGHQDSFIGTHAVEMFAEVEAFLK